MIQEKDGLFADRECLQLEWISLFDIETWDLVSHTLTHVMEISASNFGDFLQSDFFIALFTDEDDFVTKFSFWDTRQVNPCVLEIHITQDRHSLSVD